MARSMGPFEPRDLAPDPDMTEAVLECSLQRKRKLCNGYFGEICWFWLGQFTRGRIMIQKVGQGESAYDLGSFRSQYDTGEPSVSSKVGHPVGIRPDGWHTMLRSS